MITTITFKFTPESQDEMIPSKYREFRETMELFTQKGGFGPVEKIRLRWVVESGRWE